MAGNGFLRLQEIDSVLRSLGIFPSEQELQKMLNDIGASGNLHFINIINITIINDYLYFKTKKMMEMFHLKISLVLCMQSA